MGMLQLTTASGVTMPKLAIAAAEPAVNSTPVRTRRRVCGGGADDVRHSKRANTATKAAVTALSAASHSGRESHHTHVPGST